MIFSVSLALTQAFLLQALDEDVAALAAKLNTNNITLAKVGLQPFICEPIIMQRCDGTHDLDNYYRPQNREIMHLVAYVCMFGFVELKLCFPAGAGSVDSTTCLFAKNSAQKVL